MYIIWDSFTDRPDPTSKGFSSYTRAVKTLKKIRAEEAGEIAPGFGVSQGEARATAVDRFEVKKIH